MTIELIFYMSLAPPSKKRIGYFLLMFSVAHLESVLKTECRVLSGVTIH